MGKQTGRKYAAGRLLSTYRAPLAALALTALLLAADYRWRDADANPFDGGARELEAGHYDAAVAAFAKALRQNPADSAARLGLGQAYEALGWTNEAEKQYEMAAQKAVETLRRSYGKLGALQQKLGNKTEALRYQRAAQGL